MLVAPPNFLGSSKALTETGQHPTESVSATGSILLSPVQSRLATSCMSAASAEERGTPLQCAISEGFLPVVTPLRWQEWVSALTAVGCIKEFLDVPISLRNGFKLGMHSALLSTFIPKNHASTTDNPSFITDHTVPTKVIGRWRCARSCEPTNYVLWALYKNQNFHWPLLRAFRSVPS